MERLIDSVFDASLDGIVLNDPEGLRLLRANAAFCWLVGYSEEELQALRLDDVLIRTPGDLGMLRELSQTGITRGEATMRRIDGRHLRVEVSSVLTETPLGEVIVSVVRDVTDRARREAELRASEERFAAFMRHAPGSAFVKDEHGHYVYVNERWLEHVPAEVQESWSGLTDEQIYPPEVASRYRSNDAEMLADGRPLETIEIGIDREGRTTEFLAVKFPFAGPRGERFLGGFALDITERRRERARLAESEERYRSLVASLDEGIVMRDADGVIVSVNASAERILGLPRDQLEGAIEIDAPWRTIRADGSPFPTEEHPARVTLESGEPCMDVLMGLERADGVTWVMVNTQPVRPAGGRTGHAVVASFRDVSEERQLQAEREALLVRRRELERLQSLAVLAGGIAHQFNNLLTVIHGGVELLEDETHSDRDRSLFTAIRQAAERAQLLTGQMLTYSGRGHVALAPVELDTVAAEAVERFAKVLGPGVRISLSSGARVPVVGDLLQLEQVVQNLVLNAAEALGEAGGRIDVTVGTSELRTETLGAGGLEPLAPGVYASLVVADNGGGIDPEASARIFDPFFTTKFSGRGLGLAAALGIVRAHGGSIDFSSEPGRGSRFTVLLPLAAVELDPDATLPAPSPSFAPASVLVVDDHDGVRHVVAAVLEAGGYQVLEACDGAEALERLDGGECPVAAIVLDLTMPGMSGQQLLARLQERPVSPPVVVVSGFSELDAGRELAGTSVAAFLQKPFSRADLLSAVERAIAA